MDPLLFIRGFSITFVWQMAHPEQPIHHPLQGVAITDGMSSRGFHVWVKDERWLWIRFGAKERRMAFFPDGYHLKGDWRGPPLAFQWNRVAIGDHNGRGLLLDVSRAIEAFGHS